MYKYFVSFKCNEGDGNGEIMFKRKVTSIQDIRQMEKYINEDQHTSKASINNFILLEEVKINER